jgi:hypothetical protein
MSIAFEKLLNELLQECDPLCYLNIQPAKFPLVVATNCNRFTCRGYAFQIINRQKFLMHRLARNSAIASGNLARIFSQAFFPSPGAPVAGNHIGDPGLYLTEHLLRLSPNLASFGDAMVEIALTVDGPPGTSKPEGERPNLLGCRTQARPERLDSDLG